MQPQLPLSVAADRPRVLVIQLGSELECAMTRGWVDALQATADIGIVARIEHSEILDSLPNPTNYHPVAGSSLNLLRLRQRLKARDFDQVLCLNNSLANRLLGTVCVPDKRIRTRIGPPTLPSEIDAVLAVIFGRLGITTPKRRSALKLSTHTQDMATKLLRGFGFDADQQPPVLAPRATAQTTLPLSWLSNPAFSGSTPPIILLPIGEEIELIGALVGKAFLVPASDLSLRAALIGRASVLLSNDPVSIELATFMDTPVASL